MSLHRNYSFVLTWPPHYSNKPSTSLLPLPSRPFCCLWHHRSLNFPPSSLILVRYCRLRPYMVRTYLTSRSFSVLASGFASPPYPLSCGVPQGCPWPYPFQQVHHTSQHSHLLLVIKSSPLCWWHLYLSFASKTFTTAITQLQDTISDISSWMTANLLSLNPSKTEFMLIGLPQQIFKISNPSFKSPYNTYGICPQPRFYLWFKSHFF